MHSGDEPSTGVSAATAAGTATLGARIARLGFAVVFIWFGALKFQDHLSPAHDLVVATVDWLVDPAWFVPLLGVWEVGIGIGMLVNRARPLVYILLLVHMAGTFMPFFTCPELVWADPPFVWTLAGQYIMKNIIFVGAALMLWARGNRW